MQDTDFAARPAGFDRRYALALALVAGLLLFAVAPLGRAGLWDPYELAPAEFARRIGHVLMHGGALEVPGADNTVPHLNDLGRPQAQDTWVALGFKLFGLNPAAGRAMLALSGLLAVMVQGFAVSRVFGRKVGLYAGLVLASLSPFLLSSRLLLGDGLAVQAYAVAFAAMLVLMFGQASGALRQASWGALAVLGLLVGFASRGAHIAVPVLLAVAIATGFALSPRSKQGLLAIGSAVLAVLLGALCLRDAVNGPHDLSVWLGMLVRPPAHAPTFDVVLARIAHAAAPWTMLAPLAAGALAIGASDDRMQSEQKQARRAVLLTLLLSFAVCIADGFLREGGLPYLAWGPLAIGFALALSDLDSSKMRPFALALGGVVIAALVHHDFHGIPDKAAEAYWLSGARLPAAFAAWTYAYWTVVLLPFAGMTLLATLPTVDGHVRPSAGRLVAMYQAWRGAWRGMLAASHILIALALLAAALVVPLLPIAGMAVPNGMRTTLQLVAASAALMVGPFAVAGGAWVIYDLWAWAYDSDSDGEVPAHMRGIRLIESLFADARTSSTMLSLLTAGFVLPVLLLVAPALSYAAMYSFFGVKPAIAALVAVPTGLLLVVLLGWSARVSGLRSAPLLATGVAAAMLLGGSYYPALADAVSPKEIFVEYSKARSKGTFAIFGISSNTAAYYLPEAPTVLASSDDALGWISARGDSPWYLGFKSSDLPRLNQAFRKLSAPNVRNLPVLRGGGKDALLASNVGEPAKGEGNPLNEVVLAEVPTPQHALNVNLENAFEVLGYDFLDNAGKLTDGYYPGNTVHMRVYYKVTAATSTDWERFVHLEGKLNRQTADGKIAEGKYPTTLWLPGDIVVDAFDFKLEPRYGSGVHELYFGLWQNGADKRMKVVSGPADNANRVKTEGLRVK